MTMTLPHPVSVGDEYLAAILRTQQDILAELRHHKVTPPGTIELREPALALEPDDPPDYDPAPPDPAPSPGGPVPSQPGPQPPPEPEPAPPKPGPAHQHPHHKKPRRR